VKYEPAPTLRELLRRRQEWARRLLDHVDELDPADRAVLHGVYQLGMTVADLASVLGRQQRTVRQRIARLAQRISSPEFQFVLRHRRSWPAARRAIAERVILRGRSQRDVARELGISIYRVRRECDRIRLAIDVAHEQPPCNNMTRTASASATNGRMSTS
jgi:DNA-directed RNA polymerase specialized sigma24 family protein